MAGLQGLGTGVGGRGVGGSVQGADRDLCELVTVVPARELAEHHRAAPSVGDFAAHELHGIWIILCK